MLGCLELTSLRGWSAPAVVPPKGNSRKGQCMNHRTLTIIMSVVALCVVALCMALAPRKVSAQNDPAKHDEKEPVAPVYNPYPPGILPSDLNSELARVEREVAFIEGRALARF